MQKHTLMASTPTKTNTKPITNAPIRKRHWFAGSLIILVGSWITHTTTASIANPVTQDQPIQFSGLTEFEKPSTS